MHRVVAPAGHGVLVVVDRVHPHHPHPRHSHHPVPRPFPTEGCKRVRNVLVVISDVWVLVVWFLWRGQWRSVMVKW